MATRRTIQIHSMTGFANAAGECGGKRINLEIRAVNHRYLDVQFRMPEELRYLEGALREQIAAAVARGKLECRIQLQDASSGGQTLEVNKSLTPLAKASASSPWPAKTPGKRKTSATLSLPKLCSLRHSLFKCASWATTS